MCQRCGLLGLTFWLDLVRAGQGVTHAPGTWESLVPRPLPQSYLPRYSAMDYASLINNVAAMPSGSADEPHGKAVRCMVHQSVRCSGSSMTEWTLLTSLP